MSAQILNFGTRGRPAGAGFLEESLGNSDG